MNCTLKSGSEAKYKLYIFYHHRNLKTKQSTLNTILWKVSSVKAGICLLFRLNHQCLAHYRCSVFCERQPIFSGLWILLLFRLGQKSPLPGSQPGMTDPVYSTVTFSTTGGWHSVSAWYWVEGMGWGRRNILWEWCSIGIRLGSAPQTSRPWDEARVSLQQGTGNCR